MALVGGLHSLGFLIIGTGIAASVVQNHTILRVHGIAGDNWHGAIEPDGPLCKCGGRGCFEACRFWPGDRGAGDRKASGWGLTIPGFPTDNHRGKTRLKPRCATISLPGKSSRKWRVM